MENILKKSSGKTERFVLAYNRGCDGVWST